MAMINALQVFSDIPVNDPVTEIRYTDIAPVNTGLSPIEIVLPSTDAWFNLRESYFTIDVKLSKGGNGTALAYGDNFFPSPDFIHSCIKQMVILWNGTMVDSTENNYAPRAFIGHCLNYNSEDGETLLKPEGWTNKIDLPDQLTTAKINYAQAFTAGTSTLAEIFDWWNLTYAQQDAVKEAVRLKMKFLDNKVVRFIFKPYSHMFDMPHFLPPFQELRFKFKLNDQAYFNNSHATVNTITLDSFTDETFKMRFHPAQVTIKPSIARNVRWRRNKGNPYIFPVHTSKIRTFSLANRVTDFDKDQLFGNRVPTRLLVGIVDSRNFNGTIDRPPFTFLKAGMESIRLFIDAEEYPFKVT